MDHDKSAKQLLSYAKDNGRYFNWDYDEDRQNILQQKWSRDDHLLIFDELHKFYRWKSWLKGIYDIIGNEHSILVTGYRRKDKRNR
ncbi:MAG: AAA family ATPase [Pseudomonadota bacterium]